MKFRWRPRQPSLLWRVLAVTSLASIVLVSITAYVIARDAISISQQSVEEEIHASLREFEFLWRTRADSLKRESRLLSAMSDVRGAFLTGDTATIQDAGSDLWSRVGEKDAVCLVFDPVGREIASLGGQSIRFGSMSRILAEAKRSFPNQVAGFTAEESRLYYTILTPVYVESGAGPGLLNILVTGFEINDRFAKSLAQKTEGSDFVFKTGGRVVASTFPSRQDYASVTDQLLDLFGRPVGTLVVMRSLAASEQRFSELKSRIAWILALAIAVTVMVSYVLARRIIQPIDRLEKAAAEISQQNYGYRLTVDRHDELGRLAKTFNAMSDSIQAARRDLIAHERLNTIGRLSSSIVHDLRNPLAAIYGGSEMLVDNEPLPPQQAKRLAMSIYRASRHIQDMLRELSDSARGKAEPIESCRLFDVIDAARSLLSTTAENQQTMIEVDVPDSFELPLERSRMERVFLNLISNSLEASKSGGRVTIRSTKDQDGYLIEIEDTGVGMSEEVRKQLFLPFFSHGKRNGLGLGLALSRQTVVDHGGELWVAEKNSPGAKFCIRLPFAPTLTPSSPALV